MRSKVTLPPSSFFLGHRFNGSPIGGGGSGSEAHIPGGAPSGDAGGRLQGHRKSRPSAHGGGGREERTLLEASEGWEENEGCPAIGGRGYRRASGAFSQPKGSGRRVPEAWLDGALTGPAVWAKLPVLVRRASGHQPHACKRALRGAALFCFIWCPAGRTLRLPLAAAFCAHLSSHKEEVIPRG